MRLPGNLELKRGAPGLERERGRRGEPGRIAPERVRRRRRTRGANQLEALHGVRRPTQTAEHGAGGVARAHSPDPDLGHRWAAAESQRQARSTSASPLPSSTNVAPGVGCAVTMSACRTSRAVTGRRARAGGRLEQRGQAGGVRRRHAGALLHLVTGIPERHRAVGHARRHHVGPRDLAAARAEIRAAGPATAHRSGRGRKLDGQRGADADARGSRCRESRSSRAPGRRCRR